MSASMACRTRSRTDMNPANPFWGRLLRAFNPQQLCVLCLMATLGMGGFALRTFARDSDVTNIRIELAQGRLLDLRIRQCDAIRFNLPAAFFAGQIAEQADKYQALTGR